MRYAALLLLLLPLPLPAAETAEGLWYGALSLGGAKQLRIAVTIKGDGTATLNSLDQASGELPVESVEVKGDTIKLVLKTPAATFEGKISGNTIDGTWLQRGIALPLKLERVDRLPTAKRPQEPARPYPYEEEEVVFHNKDIRLAGTLTKPKDGAALAAVVLVSGSGPQDRDETVFGHKPFLVLADHLTRRGIAVLRFDDRGVGGSTGSRKTSTTLDYASDVLAAVDFLATRTKAKIGVIGHSEGGLIAPIVATRSKKVAFAILLAAPGVPGEELMTMQAKTIFRTTGASEELVDCVGDLQRRILGIIKATPDEAALRVKLRETMAAELAKLDDEKREPFRDLEAMFDAQVQRVNAPWFRWLLAYDPRPALRRVAVPILAINGSKDIQVAPRENLSAIAAASRNSTIVEIAGLNHLLQPADSGALTEYASIEETMSPLALETISRWILSLLPSTRGEGAAGG